MAASALLWGKINDYLLEVGAEREPLAFCERALAALHALVPYDAPILYLMDEEGIYDRVLVNVDQKRSDADLLCEGANPALIGSRLCISSRTAEKHIESIHRKLGVSSRQELLVRLLSTV
jgi:hypothetical protein